jgi:hemerythrin-like metal-binding protein
MALIEWREGFSVGLPAVDHEHRELIDLINRTHARLGEDASEPAVADFLGEIHARISAHFALEEKIMREAGYDRFAAHKEDHERLLDEIRDFMETYEDRANFDAAAFGARLGAWFTEHFQTEDARLHKNLR